VRQRVGTWVGVCGCIQAHKIGIWVACVHVHVGVWMFSCLGVMPKMVAAAVGWSSICGVSEMAGSEVKLDDDGGV
jgi:hypothetical protein